MGRGAFTADALLLLAAAIWGFAFVAQRVGMEHVGPFTFNAVRFALGSLALLPLALRSRRRIPRYLDGGARRDATAAEVAQAQPAVRGASLLWGGMLAGGVLFAGASLQQVGIVYTTAGKAGFITGLYAILVAVLGLLVGHRPAWGTWCGAALATAGLYLLSVTGRLQLAAGDALVLASALFWAVHVLVIARLVRTADPIRLACFQFAVVSVLSLATALLAETITRQGLTAAAAPILFGGILSVGVAYTLQVVAQRTAPPAHAAIILSLETVFAALGGWLILQETLLPRALAGCALMLAGILLSQLTRKPLEGPA